MPARNPSRASAVVRCKSDRRPLVTRVKTGESAVDWKGHADTKPRDVTRRRIDGPNGQLASVERKIAQLAAKLRSGRGKRSTIVALLHRYTDIRNRLLSRDVSTEQPKGYHWQR